jgi:LEA14-like dessication related protein
MKRGLIWVGVGSLLVGAGMWIKYQMDLSGKLVYGIKNAKLKKVTLDAVYLEMDLVITNPTEINVGINSVDVDIYANNVFITNIVNNVPIEIKPNSNSSVPLKIKINPKQLITDTGSLFNSGFKMDDVVIKTKGILKIKKFGIPIPIPFVYSSKYKEMVS